MAIHFAFFGKQMMLVIRTSTSKIKILVTVTSNVRII
jgi:hypothetical protein